MKKNGNDYLIELFDSEEKFLQYFINSIYFIDNKSFLKELEEIDERIEKDEINIVRKTKTDISYVEIREDGSFSKKLSDEKKIKRLSDENKLYIREKNGYLKIKFDSTGNYNLVKKIKNDFAVDLNKDYKNYTIAHLSDKPNNPYKHSLINIVLIPTFLNKFLDNKGVVLNKMNINVLKLVKSLILYKFKESDLYDVIDKKYDLNDKEIAFIKNFDFSTINFLRPK